MFRRPSSNIRRLFIVLSLFLQRPSQPTATAAAVMKRKSGQHRQDKRKHARSDEPSGPIIRDGASFTQLEMAPGQVTALLLLLSAVAASCCNSWCYCCHTCPCTVRKQRFAVIRYRAVLHFGSQQTWGLCSPFAVCGIHWLSCAGGFCWVPGSVWVSVPRH